MPSDLTDDLEHDHISNYEVSDDYAEKHLRRPTVPDRPVTLVVWRDAKKEPPPHSNPVIVEFDEKPHGYSSYPRIGYLSHSQSAWGTWTDDEHQVVYPQPVRWCDPVPPSEDALTLDHLKNAADACAVLAVLRKDHEPAFGDAERAVRRAIEAAEATP